VGVCENDAVRFSGLVVDDKGTGLELPGSTVYGVPVFIEVNDQPPQNRSVLVLEFSNKF
jgi:hypothetical protein